MENGPDYSTVDKQQAEAMVGRGELEALLLLPTMFGGQPVPENVVYVPIGVAAAKEGIDSKVIRPLVAEGKISRYTATPKYQGDSFIPTAITITASDPGSFTTIIKIWGEALAAE